MKAKIVVTNFSGNVGKTTVATHLLMPRLINAKLISIESINAADSDVIEDQMRGKQFGDLIETLPVLDSAVVDVGASNVEDFIDRMSSYKGAHEDFDFFLVPTVAKNKQVKDTIATIEALSELGIPPNKIIVLFNQMEKSDEVEQEFRAIFAYHNEEKNFTILNDAVINTSELFGKLKGESMDQVMSVDVDAQKELLKATNNRAEKMEISRKISQRRLAEGVKENFDNVFKVLFK